MKSDDTFDDLKQFIDARLSQTETRLEQKIEAVRTELHAEMHDGFAGIAEAIEESIAHTDRTVGTLAKRVTKLEQRAA